ncbi:MAG: glycogen synthase GlgA [Armatimonadetes bacterium]|nr:glycogen synthase GlgA [Armatimonadota bacterium]MCX7968962.1 glycogen synthase GlgA [Armatimonadota bacterium]MDW8142852.1 glycogen synthase GlgA [Armatimonadota bacterium]
MGRKMKSQTTGQKRTATKKATVERKLRVLFVVSEMFPLAKTGGLADVAGSLPKALAKRGHDVRVLMPKYRATYSIDHRSERVVDLPQIPFGGFTLGCGIDESDALKDDGVTVYLIEHFGLYDRDRLYGYDDDWVRFGLLSKVALELPKAINWQPDIIHCHDWQSGLVSAYLRTVYNEDPFFANTATVFTIHNLAYQGNFDPSVREALGLPPETFQVHGLEFHGRLSFIKGGLYYADVLTTVSPKYAQEIQTEEFGEGMHGLLRDRAAQGRLVGILNGIDYEIWNPATDEYLPVRYDSRTLVKGKTANKQALLERVGLKDGGEMVVGVVSRLAHQKGFDIVAQATEALMNLPVKLVVLGAGEQEPLFAELQKRYPEKIATRLGVVDEELAHLIYAGSDAFLMPSRFEPCGLGQMIAMKYGTAPIVHAVGGLADTVQDFDPKTKKGNGFSFTGLTVENLLATVERALSVYRDSKLWQTLQKNAMKSDFSWNKSAQDYEVKVYTPALQLRRK